MKARGIRTATSETPLPPHTEPFECDFAGLRLVVDPGVFEPGPVSRGVVDELLARCAGIANPVVVDVGTGCGAIALAFAQRRPDAEVYALDISSEAVACATRNADVLGITNVRAMHGSLLEPVRDKVGSIDAISANIPYVPEVVAAVKELERPDRWRGPRSTIVGTDYDGLGLLRELMREAEKLLRPTGIVVLEMDEWQTDLFAQEFGDQYDVVISPTRHYVTLRRLTASVQPAP